MEIKNYLIEKRKSFVQTGKIFYDPANKFAKFICKLFVKLGWMKTVDQEEVKIRYERQQVRVDTTRVIRWINHYLCTHHLDSRNCEKIVMGYDIHQQFTNEMIQDPLYMMSSFHDMEYPDKIFNILVVFDPEIDGIVFVKKAGR